MQPKPEHLGPHVASAFRDPSVARAYQYRPTYPPAVFDILDELAVDEPRRVLDVGCGTGLLARPLAERVEAVDALDVSPEMIDWGRRLPGGDHPRLAWIVGWAEDAPLRPPYALITAGDSLHWMDWPVVMARFAQTLTPRGLLAILGVGQLETPWDAQLLPIIRRYSTIGDYRPYDLVEELERRGLFRRVGARRTEPVAFAQTLDDYIESFHGRASFSRERMAPADAAAFDAAMRALVAAHAGDTVELRLVTEVTWGTPLAPSGGGG
jgi:SAM-dependent methyltransferase